MDLVLLHPGFQRAVRRIAQTSVGPPLGLAYLAAAARGAGHRVSIVDANALGWGVREAVHAVVAAAPAVIGMTATTPTMPLVAELAEALRSALPGVRIVVGGPHVTFLAERTLQDVEAIDVVARGEGERTLPALLDALAGGHDLASIPGLAFRRPGGGVVDTGIAPAIEDLDTLAPPARDLLPMARYRCSDSDRFSTLLAMRGCPCACVYCAVPAMFGRRMRYRDPVAVAEEMDQLNRRHGVDFLSFVDDTFTTDREWVLALCDEIGARGLHRNQRWICLTRPDMVDAALLAQMRAAGCVRVEMGIETGSTHGRRFLGKGVSEDAVERGFALAREAGLSTMGFAIVNVPGETREDVQRTFDLVRRVDPDYLQLSFLTPYPGTELWDTAHERGWVTTGDWSRYGFLQDAVLDHGSLPPAELQPMYQQFVRWFWLRPRTAVKLGRLLLNRTARVRPLARTAALGLASTLAGGKMGSR
jgi:anaerobic magnesium-protoporphyrin IX monomethyl ester cyclase